MCNQQKNWVAECAAAQKMFAQRRPTPILHKHLLSIGQLFHYLLDIITMELSTAQMNTLRPGFG